MIRFGRFYFQKLRAIKYSNVSGLIKVIMVLLLYQAVFYLCPYNYATWEMPASTVQFVAEALKSPKDIYVLAHDKSYFFVGISADGETDFIGVQDNVLKVVEKEGLSEPKIVYHVHDWFVKKNERFSLSKCRRMHISNVTLYVPKGKLKVVYFDMFKEMEQRQKPEATKNGI